ncbi:MAG: hypothetical protein K6F37_01885 [Lachnospiraceae bacterium]|nr:hypothetical protein [Lachnospiraceae bacterium]
MKKLFLALACVLLVAGMTGCGKKNLDVSRSTVYVDKNGKVTSVDIADFNESYYSEDELNSYIEELVSDYTSSYGETVKVTEVSVDEETSVAKVVMTYDDASDYVQLNGLVLYEGTVGDAKDAGYSFEADYYDVSGTEAVEESYSPADEDLVVVSKGGSDVMVDGTIKYVSVLDGASLVLSDSKDTVGYDGEDISEKTMIVIYKR